MSKPNLTRCLECSGRGFAITPITGRMAGTCRSCKGSGSRDRCTHRFMDLPDGLQCVRDAHPERPGDHAYSSTSVDDAHTTSEAEAEATR